MLSKDEILKTAKNGNSLAEKKGDSRQTSPRSVEFKNEKPNDNRSTFFDPGKDSKIQQTDKSSGDLQKSTSDPGIEKLSSKYCSKSSPDIKKSDMIFEKIKSKEFPKIRNFTKKSESSSRDHSSDPDSDSFREPAKEANNSKSIESDSPKILTPTPTRKLSNALKFLSSEDRNISPRKKNQATQNFPIHEKLNIDFINSLPLKDKNWEICVNKIRALLQTMDSKIMVDYETNSNLKLLYVNQNHINSTGDIASKTVILFDKGNVQGSGANSTIFKGYDLTNQKYWAIKFIRTNKNDRHNEIENLKKRQWLFGNYYMGDQTHALIMKFIPGDFLLKTLYTTDDKASKESINENYCVAKKELSGAFKLDLAIQLLEELVKLHKKYGLLHRDIKPENIHVYYKNLQLKVKILDLGDAVSINSRELGLRGTKAYMDPRIEHSPYSEEADIYSMGVVIWEMLTSRNFQKLFREELKKNIQKICQPIISLEQLETMMDDVSHIDLPPERYDSFDDHKINLENCILARLKKLARGMLTSPLPDSFLEDEIKALKQLKNDSQSLSTYIELFYQGKLNLQSMFNSKNNFFHTNEFDVTSIVRNAMNLFKMQHLSNEFNENVLSL